MTIYGIDVQVILISYEYIMTEDGREHSPEAKSSLFSQMIQQIL